MSKDMQVKLALMQVDDDLGKVIGDLNDMKEIDEDIMRILLQLIDGKVAKVKEIVALKTK